jgi:hypothetical protein
MMLRESNSHDDPKPQIGTAGNLGVAVFRKVTPRQGIPRSILRRKFRYHNTLTIKARFYSKFASRVSPVVLYKLSRPQGAETPV